MVFQLNNQIKEMRVNHFGTDFYVFLMWLRNIIMTN